MGELLRSEEMSLVQFYIQSESAYAAVSELGHLGLVQFRDVRQPPCPPCHHVRDGLIANNSLQPTLWLALARS